LYLVGEGELDGGAAQFPLPSFNENARVIPTEGRDLLNKRNCYCMKGGTSRSTEWSYNSFCLK